MLSNLIRAMLVKAPQPLAPKLPKSQWSAPQNWPMSKTGYAPQLEDLSKLEDSLNNFIRIESPNQQTKKAVMKFLTTLVTKEVLSSLKSKNESGETKTWSNLLKKMGPKFTQRLDALGTFKDTGVQQAAEYIPPTKWPVNFIPNTTRDAKKALDTLIYCMQDTRRHIMSLDGLNTLGTEILSQYNELLIDKDGSTMAKLEELSDILGDRIHSNEPNDDHIEQMRIKIQTGLENLKKAENIDRRRSNTTAVCDSFLTAFGRYDHAKIKTTLADQRPINTLYKKKRIVVQNKGNLTETQEFKIFRHDGKDYVDFLVDGSVHDTCQLDEFKKMIQTLR